MEALTGPPMASYVPTQGITVAGLPGGIPVWGTASYIKHCACVEEKMKSLNLYNNFHY